jgi:nicotinate dehydrogenase subunit A
LGLQAVVQAFIDAQAAQCGYCLNGMIMMVARLLRDQPDADAEDVLRTLSGNLCRCGAHVEILQAALLAAQRLQAGT